MMPPICCVCSRQQHAVEMYDITLSTDGKLPDYLEVLPNELTPQFSDDEFQFTNPHLNGTVLDSDGIRVAQSWTTIEEWVLREIPRHSHSHPPQLPILRSIATYRVPWKHLRTVTIPVVLYADCAPSFSPPRHPRCCFWQG